MGVVNSLTHEESAGIIVFGATKLPKRAQSCIPSNSSNSHCAKAKPKLHRNEWSFSGIHLESRREGKFKLVPSFMN